MSFLRLERQGLKNEKFQFFHFIVLQFPVSQEIKKRELTWIGEFLNIL